MVSQITLKSVHDRFDASKGSRDALTIDFGAPKSRPKATKSVQDAPERASVSSKMAPMLTSELTRMLRRSQERAWKLLNGSEIGFEPPKTLLRNLNR